ncbi:MAG: GNAT family N-acetyltransferase, partial [Mariniphaga sp.]|nr:GNAT family N-acetyltransferase [Mariniphaga sp.]
EVMNNPVKEYSHLILRPYPERLMRTAELKDGVSVNLRPIKPEDEPMWLDFLASCSKESIYHRFKKDINFESHDVATQFCFIDYDREIAIVAEVEEEGNKKIVGVGRLISDPDKEKMNYTIIITDAWQHKELGLILTEYCMEIAKNRQIKLLSAETTRDNKPMISVFKKLDFQIKNNDDNTVTATKELT